MSYCPKCGRKLPVTLGPTCPICGFKFETSKPEPQNETIKPAEPQVHQANISEKPAAPETKVSEHPIEVEEPPLKAAEPPLAKAPSEPVSIPEPTPPEPTPIEPTPIEPTPIEPTPIEPTPIEPTPIEPTPIEPTPIEPTPIEPTPIEPTPIEPTPITPGKFVKLAPPFNLKYVIIRAIMSLLGFIGMAVIFGVGTGVVWVIGLLFGALGIGGIIGIIAEILKLPLNQAFIDALNNKLAAGKPKINPNKLNIYQKITYRLRAASGNIQIIPAASLAAALLAGVISIGTTLGGGSIVNTTITGRWAHEIGSVSNSTWVVNITMWGVDPSTDSGTIYMNVATDGTFDIVYQDTVYAYGEWNQNGEDYVFLHHDPSEILMSIYEHYRIRGNYLYIYGGLDNYFVKS